MSKQEGPEKPIVPIPESSDWDPGNQEELAQRLRKQMLEALEPQVRAQVEEIEKRRNEALEEMLQKQADALGMSVEELKKLEEDKKYGPENELRAKLKQEGDYQHIGSFADGLAVAIKDGKVGVIDKEGNVVIEFGKYGFIGSFADGLAMAIKDGKLVKIDKSGNEVKS